jgi:choline dehydrogenase-like flavoprotein
LRSDARPFDIIIIGGGTFGSAIAQHLFYADKTHSHRILVLEAGRMLLTEHVQNLPMIGLNVPGPTEIDPGIPREEVLL